MGGRTWGRLVAVAAILLLAIPLCESESLKDKFTREGKLKSKDSPKEAHPIKTMCVIPSYMDKLKEGMQLFYAYKSGIFLPLPPGRGASMHSLTRLSRERFPVRCISLLSFPPTDFSLAYLCTLPSPCSKVHPVASFMSISSLFSLSKSRKIPAVPSPLFPSCLTPPRQPRKTCNRAREPPDPRQ